MAFIPTFDTPYDETLTNFIADGACAEGWQGTEAITGAGGHGWTTGQVSEYCHTNNLVEAAWWAAWCLARYEHTDRAFVISLLRVLRLDPIEAVLFVKQNPERAQSYLDTLDLEALNSERSKLVSAIQNSATLTKRKIKVIRFHINDLTSAEDDALAARELTVPDG